MKIQVVSDLHLEFGPISIENAGADVLILSGDICVASELQVRDTNNLLGESGRSKTFHTFFEDVCNSFKHVVYIAGNHEHYHGDFPNTVPRLRERLSYLNNLYILDKQVIKIDDVVFIGGTLWTDMNKEDPVTIQGIKGYMNDYQIIQCSDEVVNFKTFVNKDKPVGLTDDEWLALPYMERVTAKFGTRPAKFSPERSIAEHKEMLFVIYDTLQNIDCEKIVIVGHHAPCKKSTKPKYERDVVVNGAYSSDLTELMMDNPKIKLWTHGHTHDSYDYTIGSTRVFCNPRGYHGYELNNEFRPETIIEV